MIYIHMFFWTLSYFYCCISHMHFNLVSIRFPITTTFWSTALFRRRLIEDNLSVKRCSSYQRAELVWDSVLVSGNRLNVLQILHYQIRFQHLTLVMNSTKAAFFYFLWYEIPDYRKGILVTKTWGNVNKQLNY